MDFRSGMSQTQIGQRLHISQMHVSGSAPAPSATSAPGSSTRAPGVVPGPPAGSARAAATMTTASADRLPAGPDGAAAMTTMWCPA
jgi:hypothetical protein